MSTTLRSITLATCALLLTQALHAEEPTESELEHVAPDAPGSQDNHPMSYREMARMMEMDDKSSTGKVMFDRLEWRDANGGSAFAWNADAWYGNDYNKLWLKSEGEREHGADATASQLAANTAQFGPALFTQSRDTRTTARTELLWDHTIARWWTLQTGVRHDSGSGDSRDWAALGVQGLASGFFDVEATAYVGDSGRTAARISAERDLLFTQRLILQPEFEVNLYGKDDPANGIGSGLADFELALRLRYEFRRELASYVGAVWARRFGSSADFARAAGEDPNDIQWVAGLRIWF